jgi:hypothetical protein
MSVSPTGRAPITQTEPSFHSSAFPPTISPLGNRSIISLPNPRRLAPPQEGIYPSASGEGINKRKRDGGEFKKPYLPPQKIRRINSEQSNPLNLVRIDGEIRECLKERVSGSVSGSQKPSFEVRRPWANREVTSKMSKEQLKEFVRRALDAMVMEWPGGAELLLGAKAYLDDYWRRSGDEILSSEPLKFYLKNHDVES